MPAITAKTSSSVLGAMSLQRNAFSIVERRGGIAIVTLNRPEVHNALHPAAHHELNDVFDSLAAYESLRAAIVTDADKSFCAGYDLLHNLETGIVELGRAGFGGVTSRTAFPIPLIAAVNGAAFGGGFEIALACDLIIASDKALFALPEPKVGWSALSGGVQRLPRAIGTKRAMGMILTGRVVDAPEGERLGFVNQVCAPESLMDEALRWAEMIEATSPLATRCNLEVAYGSLDQPDLASALDLSNYTTVQAMLESEDAKEGKAAFVDKRRPVWKGR
jgi:enoyl-CoA hydratase/carnithine racemase